MRQFLPVIIGFAIANFGWQAFQMEPSWKLALERSYFQAAAIGYLWFVSVFR